MTFDTNGWELAIASTSTIGFLAQLSLLHRSRQSLTALAGIKNGRRKIARFHLFSGQILLACHAVFIYFGVRLMLTMDPPAYSIEFVINILLFIGITAGLMAIGFIQLWLWNSLSKH